MPASNLHFYLPQGGGALRHQLTVTLSLLFDWLSRLKVNAIYHRRTSTFGTLAHLFSPVPRGSVPSHRLPIPPRPQEANKHQYQITHYVTGTTLQDQEQMQVQVFVKQITREKKTTLFLFPFFDFIASFHLSWVRGTNEEKI